MTTWVLIFWMYGGTSVTTHSQEFTSRERCEAALVLARKETQLNIYFRGVCTEK